MSFHARTDDDMTSVKTVFVSAAVAQTMVAHALVTEKEEILGLCIGHYDPSSVQGVVVPSESVCVTQLYLLRRRQKAADRVEVSDKDLADASHFAESVGLHVVGWYHSHPHITIHPSHVDLNTQQLYQRLDTRFIGLIVSAFDKSQGHIGLLAFQSGPMTQQRVLPVQFLPDSTDPVLPLSNMVKLVQIQAAEERESYCAAVGASDSTSAAARPHPLVSAFAASTYQRSLVRLLEIQVAPVITALEEQRNRTSARLAQLKMQLDSQL